MIVPGHRGVAILGVALVLAGCAAPNATRETGDGDVSAITVEGNGNVIITGELNVSKLLGDDCSSLFGGRAETADERDGKLGVDVREQAGTLELASATQLLAALQTNDACLGELEAWIEREKQRREEGSGAVAPGDTERSSEPALPRGGGPIPDPFAPGES